MSEVELYASKPVVFHILLALAAGQLHGYGILRAVREQSRERIPLRTGSLYRHLGELISRGLVDEVAPPRRGRDPRRGIHYRLTRAGKEALEAETRHLRELVARVGELRPALRRSGR